MQTVKYCIDCMYATQIFPDQGPAFYQCGNPDYAQVNLIDGSKIWPTCETARYQMCGSVANGFLPIKPPDYKEWTRHTEDDGVALVSIAHPRPPWYKTLLFWLRHPFGMNMLNKDSLEDIEIEVRRD